MLTPREPEVVIHEPYYHHDDFWWSPAGYVAKWAIVGTIFFLFVAWFVGGYLHARHRVSKGRTPLRYHRWLLPHAHRYGPQGGVYYHAQPYGWEQGRAYPMHGYYAEPLPVYSNDVPPTYQPPPGATKTNPDQSGRAASMSPPPPGMVRSFVAPAQTGAGTGDAAPGGAPAHNRRPSQENSTTAPAS